MDSSHENPQNSFPVDLLQVIKKNTSTEGFEELVLVTSRAETLVRYYGLSECKTGIVMIGGVGGGFDTPAHLLYPKLASDLLGRGFSSLRIRYREPHNLDESVFDVLTGLSFLHPQGIDLIGLVGHSFGGAVAIRAAAIDHSVATVVTLAAQSYGSGVVSELGPQCSILLVHGTSDTVLPAESSQHIYMQAREPKKISIYKAGHRLDEISDLLFTEVREWLITWVRGD